MKLNPDLLRDILVWCEDNLPQKSLSIMATNIHIPDWSSQQIVYHLTLLSESGYIKTRSFGVDMNKDFIVERMTMNGHELLSTMRNETTWKKIKEILDKFGLVAFPTILTQLSPFLLKLLGIQ